MQIMAGVARFVLLLTLYLQCMKTCLTQDCSCEKDSVWLVNGYSELEGRVELHQDGQQFAVCCPFSPTTANMICKRLGFSSEGARELPHNHFGVTEANHDISYEIECSSDTCCSCRNTTQRCQQQAAVRCQPRRCTEWDVRLVGGVSESVVREVCVNEMWTPLHPSSEGLSIICRQLGLSNYGAKRTTSGRLNDTALLAVEIHCAGNEHHLSHCSASTTWTHQGVSSITCQQKCHLCNDHSFLESVTAIVALGVGCFAFIVLVAGYLLLQLLIARKCRKRLQKQSKKRKRKVICASLNHIFTQPGDGGSTEDSSTATTVGAPANKDSETKQRATSASEIATSQCVAYTAVPPAGHPKQVPPEDVPPALGSKPQQAATNIVTSQCIAYTAIPPVQGPKQVVSAMYEDVP